jgi:hypothetical protein
MPDRSGKRTARWSSLEQAVPQPSRPWWTGLRERFEASYTLLAVDAPGRVARLVLGCTSPVGAAATERSRDVRLRLAQLLTPVANAEVLHAAIPGSLVHLQPSGAPATLMGPAE